MLQRISDIYSSNMVETEEEARVYAENEESFLEWFEPALEGDDLYWAQVWLANHEETYEDDCDTWSLALDYNEHCIHNGGSGHALR